MYRVMKRHGFTLTELLIALTLLGVISALTIPKVLQAQSSKDSLTRAKSVASAVVGAYSNYRMNYGTGASMSLNHLTQYINYVDFTTTAQIDGLEGSGSMSCNGGGAGRCYKMQNGSYLFFWTSDTFGGTSNNYCLRFIVDPDGKYGGSTTGNSKSVQFELYANGDLRTYGTMKSGTWCGIWGPLSADPTKDPVWFTWDS